MTIPAETMSDLLNRFTYHEPNPESVPKFEEIRGMSRDIAIRASQLAPRSRELSLALTKLEEFSFWVNAAIARSS